jgi:hypothetical protein
MIKELQVEFPVQPPRQLGRKGQDHRERSMHLSASPQLPDVGSAHWHFVFVPILLQKSQIAGG